MQPKNQKRLLFGLKLLAAVAVLTVLISTGLIDLKNLREVVTSGWKWVAIGAAVFLFTIGITAWRWNLLLQAQNIRIPYFLALRLTFVGQFFSTLMPGATGGDLIKAYYVWKSGTRKAAAVTTVFLDRVIGFYCMFGISAVLVLIQRQVLWGRPESRPLVILVPLLFAGMTVFIFALFTGPVRKIFTATGTGPPIPFGHAIYKVYQSLDLYRESKSVVVLALVISFISNLVQSMGFLAYGMALGEGSMQLLDYILVVPLGMVVNGLPIFPMGLGQGEAAYGYLYKAIAGSLNGEEAAILFHVVVLFWSAMGVFFYLSIRSDILTAVAEIESDDEGVSSTGLGRPAPRTVEIGGVKLADYAGSVHLHTNYSDGSDSIAKMLSAAQSSDLDFVMVTDHDTLQAQKDGYHGWQDGVLSIIGTEISSPKGHCLTFLLNDCDGLKKLSPPEYLKEIKKQNALAIVAHPVSPRRPEFGFRVEPWAFWDSPDYDGLEIWSYMHDWLRDASHFSLLRHLLHPLDCIRGPEPELLQRWDELGQNRKVVGIGGTDNHARKLPLRSFPIYLFKVLPHAFVFRTLRTHVLCEPLTRDSERDIRKICEAVQAGHCYIAYDYLAPASGFLFTAVGQTGEYVMGDEVEVDAPVELKVKSPEPVDLRLLRNGQEVGRAQGEALSLTVEEPGVYRVEARLNEMPWVFSNPIYLRPPRS